MDTDRLLELVPHYLVMILLVFLVLEGIRATVGALDFWLELAIIAVVVLSYRPIVMRLGLGPSAWER